MRIFIYFLITTTILAFSGCNDKSRVGFPPEEDDASAKSDLQGIWLDSDGENVTFRVKGDTVYFPDDASAPLYFRVEKDSFVLYGINTAKYPIVRLSSNSFEFVNSNGEHVHLVKNNDSTYLSLFNRAHVIAVNQNRLIKSDTVVYFNDEKYHCYVQVNPTTYKVFKTTYNDEGVEIDKVYYDNIVHLSIFHGSEKVYSSNVTKADFSRQLPSQLLKQSVLGDMSFYKIDHEGIHYFAVLGIPNSSSNFMVEFVVSFDGRVIKRIRN